MKKLTMLAFGALMTVALSMPAWSQTPAGKNQPQTADKKNDKKEAKKKKASKKDNKDESKKAATKKDSKDKK